VCGLKERLGQKAPIQTFTKLKLMQSGKQAEDTHTLHKREQPRSEGEHRV